MRERFFRWEEGSRKSFGVYESTLPLFKRFAGDYIVEARRCRHLVHVGCGDRTGGETGPAVQGDRTGGEGRVQSDT